MIQTKTKLKTIIVEDNPADLMKLKKIIEDSVDIIGEAEDANAALELYENEKPDLMLLDVDMPGISGVELAGMIMNYEEPPQIAFITGRTDFATKAFDLDATDYVVKPFEVERVEKLLEKANEKHNAAQAEEVVDVKDLEAKIRSIVKEQAKLSKDRLPVKDYKERTIRFLNPGEIVFAQRDSRKVNITTEGEVFPTYYTIDKLEARLEDHGFKKANSGLLVNINFVEHMIPNGDGSYDLILRTFKDKSITVSRSCSKAILSSLAV